MKAPCPILIRLCLALFALLALVHTSPAAWPSAQGRTIKDIDLIPKRVLERSISPKFFKTLLISPIGGWVVVRGQLQGTTLSGLKVVHSEPNDANNHLALQRAREVQIAGDYKIDNPNAKSPVLVHLLLYKTADGMLALSFANIDKAGGNQMEYFGCARLAVLKDGGKWVEIQGPSGLQGKGLAVRQGMKNDLGTAMKLERLTTAAEATNFGGK